MKRILLNIQWVFIILMSGFVQAGPPQADNSILAAVSFAETQQPEKKDAKSEKKKVKTKKKKIEKYEIQGYVKRSYVRFVVDLIDGKEIRGHMFNEQDEESYVYGEYVDGVLHIYDLNGEHFIVLTQ